MGALSQLVKRFVNNWPLWTVIVAFFIVGLLLILLPALNDWVWDRGITKEIGLAFLIAAILGGSIHVYLERDIAKDAFEGAMGYFLPPDVKEAVRFISALEWFAEEFSMIVEIENAGDDLVKATVKIRKYLKNITHSALPVKSTIHIDEWGHERKSYIIECELHTSSKVVKFDPDKIKYDRSTLYAETDSVPIGAGEHVTLLATAVEFKRPNDDLHFAMPYACKEAKITIRAPDNFERSGGFSTEQRTDKHPHQDEYVVKGFCLPWQRAMVRWWPKEAGQH